MKYLDKATKMAVAFEKFTLHHVPREQNERVDLLSKLATSQKRGSLGRSTIEEPDVSCVEERMTWISPLIAYLRDKILLKDPAVAKRLIKDVARYIIIRGELYMRGFSFPLLRCIEGEEAYYRLCDSHIGGRALVSKIARADYYWPTLKGDYMDYIHGTGQHTPGAAALHHLPMVVPQVGGGHFGTFSTGSKQVKYLIVVVDYFTKWIEVEPMTTISAERIKRFYWKKIICRFSLPTEIVLDNGTQFASQSTTDFCTQLKIKQRFMSVEHPQTNGQAEAANKRASQKTSRDKGEVGRGASLIISNEIGELSPWTALFQPAKNEDVIRVNLDLLQEAHEVAQVREYAAKAREIQICVNLDFLANKSVTPSSAGQAELTLVNSIDSNKLTPIWEGPYRITEEVGKGAYHLEHLDDKKIPRTWNAMNLRVYNS
ncbi:Pol polyprotein, partial [Mucuna pruriens]